MTGSSDKPRAFPVLNPIKLPGTVTHVRWDALNEEQAQANHGQSLARLAERGGMDPIEIVCNIQRRRLYPRNLDYAWAAGQLLSIAVATS